MPNGKPNILILWGDDIGITRLSCQEPPSFSIDRVIAKLSEGIGSS